MSAAIRVLPSLGGAPGVRRVTVSGRFAGLVTRDGAGWHPYAAADPVRAMDPRPMAYADAVRVVALFSGRAAA